MFTMCASGILLTAVSAAAPPASHFNLLLQRTKLCMDSLALYELSDKCDEREREAACSNVKSVKAVEP